MSNSCDGDFAGTVAIVTGASSGMGSRIAETLGKRGASVVLSGRDAASLEAAERAVLAGGAKARVVPADLAAPGSGAALVEAAVEAFGRLDIIAANAGLYPMEHFGEISPDSLRTVFEVNALSVFELVQAALPVLTRSPRPAVCVTSSITGTLVAFPGLSHYGAAKSAVNGLVRSLAVELGPSRVRVNAVSPGTIRNETAPDPPREEFASSRIPLQRLGTWDDIAEAVAFLCSERASYITGQALALDGGQTLVER